jgi:taurine dioxygenase
MLKIQPNETMPGARVTGVDLSRPLAGREFAQILHALGEHAVLCFPDQPIDATALRSFSARFGELQIISRKTEPGMPEVSILSNVIENGEAIGLPDAGQDWHTDMTYNRVPGFVNVLVAHRVPMRDGKALGGTEFADTRAAYDDLPDPVKRKLATATAMHDWNKFQEHMRIKKGSKRPPLTAAQKAQRPPVPHPVFLTHPISGRKIIYVNPGFTTHIEGMDETGSRDTLDHLFAHVLQAKYRWTHRWSVGDVLVWDHLSTWHCAIADYRADEYRLMKRCQVLADKVFDRAFLQTALEA